MTLLSRAQLAARRQVTAPGASLAPLFESLAAELEPLLGRDLYLPRSKALLSRAGGRCGHDGGLLEFDPFSPGQHRCGRCGRVHEGELHHRAWVTSYQLWLAERAVHGAVFATLRDDERHGRFARDVLLAYADRYLDYPNADNVLGPSRLFFSTYLESIWLLQICVAAELLAQAGDTGTADRVRERIVEPARALIGEFDEGRSNRQVWNNAALLAAAALCGDRAAFARHFDGASGLLAHLADALLEDGSWYEGENYHQFALRGLWYAVVLAEGQGARVPAMLVSRFHRAFAMPFATALPDFTMPSRKDSQYAVSLRQWRLAELTELGYARTADSALEQALRRCYEPGHERLDTGRARSTADVERNTPSGALTRADLNWRALLFARPELPEADVAPIRSAHLRAQGYAVFRRPGDVYVGFDYGQSGGGHGHPDRLNLTIYERGVRWLDDLGTGSYVDPSLHWYRSTLAHNAPLVDGRSQPLRDGVLRAWDEREGMGWVSAEFVPAPGTLFRRSIVVAPDYLIDVLQVSGGDRVMDLPLHLEGTPHGLTLEPMVLSGAGGLEDGFDFVRDVRGVRLTANTRARIDAASGDRKVAAHVECSRDATLFEATAPGQPAATPRRFLVVRTRGDAVVLTVFDWTASLAIARTDDDGIGVTYPDGGRHLHRQTAGGWHVDLYAGGARSSINLEGVEGTRESTDAPEPARRSHTIRRGTPLRFDLGREHYRRSEQDWEAAGAPAAVVTLDATADRLIIVADVRAGERVFVPADATNPFDNEHADTMGAGLQLYARTAEGEVGWTLVPEVGAGVRVRAQEPSAAFAPPRATWKEALGGYQVSIELPLPPAAASGHPFDVDLIVNETIRGRARRRGQLVLSGAKGEWVYLRGDRHAHTGWIRIAVE